MGRVIFLAVCGITWIAAAVGVTPGFAQPPSREPMAAPPATQPATAPPLGGITESKLGPTYLRDQNGNTVVYPSLTLEEIDRLIQKDQQQRAPQPPRYTLVPGATIVGSVNGPAAELEVKVQVQLTKSVRSEEEWVRIPLRLNQAILLPPVTHTGGGEFLLDFDSKADGYVVWLRAAPGSSHSFAIRLKAPLVSKNGVRQIVLAIPDTSTNVRLTVAGNGADARVNGNMGNILTTRRSGAGQTDLIVDAAGGEIDLSWRELVELPPVLAAFGNILISLEGRQLEFDAQLNVRSYGPPIDSFTVRLPPGTELIATNQFTQPGLEYSLLPEVAGNHNGGGRRVLVRRKEGKTSGLIEARLRCHSSASVLDTAAPWQLAGFEVIDAKHQKGTIDFQVDGDWSIDWVPDVNVRQVDDLPDVLRQQRLAARFEYDRQPFSLQASIREKKTRIAVEPMWTILVQERRLSLDGLLKYRISGARAKPLEIDTGGWNIQQVTPAELLSGSWHVENNKLTVPLISTVQSGAGEFELKIRATRELNQVTPNLNPTLPPLGPSSVIRWNLQKQNSQVSFTFPQPVSDAGLPALIVIAPDDSIELTPVTEQLRRLVVDTLPPEINQPTRHQQPLVYREDAGNEPAIFVGQFRVRPQTISVSAETRVAIHDRETAVEQQFLHAVSFDPVKRLRFLAPRGMVESGRFELLVDGEPTNWTHVDAESSLEESQIPIAVDLRDPRIGECTVVFRHRHPREPGTGRPPNELNIPLFQPAPNEATTLSSHRLRITAPGNLGVSLPSDKWSPAHVTPGEMLFSSTELPEELLLTVAAAKGATKRSTDLQRVWVQSLLTDQERRERACFRLTTNEQTLTFRLPPGVNAEDITVAVNGQRTDRFSVSNQLDLRVDLGEATNARETTVELWYWFTAHSVAVGRICLQAPFIDGVSRADRVYWQLILPRYEYLAWYPSTLISENSWDRRSWWWTREPRRSQPELEVWCSGSTQPDLVHDIPFAFNAYLFSSVGGIGPRNVYTMTREAAALVIAGFILIAGAALFYLPILRHPLLLLAAGVTAIAAAFVFPEPAIAAAQLILVGLALVLVMGVLMSLLSHSRAQRPVQRSASSLSADSRSSKPTSSRLVPANSHVTTATIQAPLPVSATGNQP